MAEFKGLKKDEHAALTRAVTMYANLTGEKVNISGIPVASDEDDPKKKAEQDAKELAASAKATAAAEDANRELRRLQVRQQGGGGIQDENPGPGQPAMVTERAKAQGVSRKGEEPATVTGKS